MNKICLIFRRPVKEFFSIEKVFALVKSKLLRRFEIVEMQVPAKGANIRSLYKNIRFGFRVRADVYHITGDVHYMSLAFPGSKTILTIHDCVFLYQNAGIRKLLLLHLFLKWPVRHAKWVSTISEATKADIIRFTGCDPAKVIVIPNPLPENITYTPRNKEAGISTILFIGTTENKNLNRVVQALSGIECELHVIGKVHENVKRLLDKHVKWRNSYHLSESEMNEAYSRADLILFPSLFEGFGLPIIEGQKAGRPVITSQLSPMKEIAGGAACLVDPLDVASIRLAVKKVLDDPGYASQLVQAGFANIKRYSADIISEQYSDLYMKILESPKQRQS